MKNNDLNEKTKRGKKKSSICKKMLVKSINNNLNLKENCLFGNIQNNIFISVFDNIDHTNLLSFDKLNYNNNNNTPNNNIFINKNNDKCDMLYNLYKPNFFDELIIDETLKFKLNIFINKSSLQNIIFYGNSGVGKTLIMTLFINKFIQINNYDLLSINCSDNRGLDIIREKITKFCINGGNKKIIFFDDIDNLTAKAQNLLSITMEDHKDNIIFCLIATNINNIIDTIKNKCLMTHIKPTLNTSILENICTKLNINFNISSLSLLLNLMNGDIRQSINNIEIMYHSNLDINDDNIYSICYQPNPIKIINIIKFCLSKNIINAIKEYDEIILQSYCNIDIIQSMIHILKSVKIDEEIRINYVKLLSDLYMNIMDNIDSNLQMYGCLCKMCKIV